MTIKEMEAENRVAKETFEYGYNRILELTRYKPSNQHEKDSLRKVCAIIFKAGKDYKSYKPIELI